MKGSVFIQALCKELNERQVHTDICTIATNVNKMVMQSYGRIQAPIFENQLGDVVFFANGNTPRTPGVKTQDAGRQGHTQG